MKHYNSKEFRKRNSFVLYDFDDNIIFYLDNVEELIKYTNVRVSDIVKNFNFSDNDYIRILIDGIYYKLYTYEK